MVSGRFAAAAACGLAALSILAAPGPAALAAGAGRPGLKMISYHGYTFRVPASWPVVRERPGGSGCVRFDQHAVYVGQVPADQSCPSWLLGTTESILIEPGALRGSPESTEDPIARQITASAPRVTVFATFHADPTVIYRILASASLPAPVIRAASPATGIGAAAPAGQAAAGRPGRRGGERVASGQSRPKGHPALPAAVASYRGLGFDACTAPSRLTMRAWRRHSPYRAIGIYIGGADRACAQRNLSASWVRSEARAGWHFIPLYAGPQAAFGELRSPASQGRAAARDGVAAMRSLGFGRRTPIYYDMEAFGRRVRPAAMRFLSAWTTRLHRLGYSSGVYSSSDSGIADLARAYSRHVFAMPNVIYDALWNGSATTTDRHLHVGQWHDERIHQFSGNVTQRFGGHTINIDKDVLDVRLRSRAATAQPTAAVTQPDGAVDLFYVGAGHQLWLDRMTPGKGWARPARVPGAPYSPPSAVWTGSAVEAFYKGPGGNLWVDTFRPDGAVATRQELPMMGILGSGPRAVSQADGGIDVFWRGSADDHLWHGEYLPGAGWHGPQRLGGDLAGVPAPVVSSPGTTAVVWEGTDRDLWSVRRGPLGDWTVPHDRGMGPLGGAPQATAQPDGGIQVYWHGSGNARVWEGFYQAGAGWRGPRDLGGAAESAPWPATAAGTVHVLWRDPKHFLGYISHRKGQRWNLTGWQHPVVARLGWLGSPPFAAVGGARAPLRVFWRGHGGQLWTAAMQAGTWSRAARLTG